MIFISSDAFNNPDSPIYYIVGVVFLMLIAALVAGYFLLSKYLEKKKKEKYDTTQSPNYDGTNGKEEEQAVSLDEKEENSKSNNP